MNAAAAEVIGEVMRASSLHQPRGTHTDQRRHHGCRAQRMRINRSWVLTGSLSSP